MFNTFCYMKYHKFFLGPGLFKNQMYLALTISMFIKYKGKLLKKSLTKCRQILYVTGLSTDKVFLLLHWC